MLQSKVIVHKLTTSYYYYLPCITFFLECIYVTKYYTLSGRPEVTLVIISEKKGKKGISSVARHIEKAYDRGYDT